MSKERDTRVVVVLGVDGVPPIFCGAAQAKSIFLNLQNFILMIKKSGHDWNLASLSLGGHDITFQEGLALYADLLELFGGSQDATGEDKSGVVTELVVNTGEGWTPVFAASKKIILH